MNPSEIGLILHWWFLFLIIGTCFLPLTAILFSNFVDKGYIFSKIIGILFVSYTVFLLGILKIFPFINLTTLIVIIISGGVNLLLLSKKKPLNIKASWKIFAIEEIIFLVILFFWSLIRGYLPDIHGLEKYMDFGFINSIIRSSYFPPKDMWFTPFIINYYYFGHLVTAVLTKLSDIPSSITYNLMIATIAAFTFTGSFSIGFNLLSNVILNSFQDLKKKELQNLPNKARKIGIASIAGGFLIGFLTTFAGNLHTIYTFFKPYVNENPRPLWDLALSISTFPNSYWYPNATRFIHNTIHEFPIYSFVVSDLHGHVLGIPFVLLTIAILFSLILKSKISNPKQIQISNIQFPKRFELLNHLKFIWNLEFGIWNLLLISFLLAVMYMTNAWDGIIYFIFTLLVLLYITFKKPNQLIAQVLIIGIGFIIFSLPFSLNFKPFVSGIGILCAPTFLTNIGKLGPFLFEPDHCQKSPLWQMAILYGFFYFWVTLFIIKKKLLKDLFLINNLKLKIKNLSSSDLFVLILILISTFLIIVPEFIYAKDIYPAHYRANTMFKLVYQSFIMLSISSGYILVQTISNLKYHPFNKLRTRILNIFKFLFFIFAILIFILVSIYPYFSITSFYGNLQSYHGLDGIFYLKNQYPSDYEAIVWLNKNIKGQPVILEAQGDSYTDYARISASTGLPTVLGWTVHEWLWRGTYDIPAPRIQEVQTLFESTDFNLTKNLINKYKIKLVFLGELEKQKYKNLNENKFDKLGKVVFENPGTKIYLIP